MHLSLAGSAVLMLLLLFALGNFIGVQAGQITRDVDNGQLTDKLRNLQSLWESRSLKLVAKRQWCGNLCASQSECGSFCICHMNSCWLKM
uniref:Conotoxin n=2 Tax=Conus praecellens TaxID=128530 RepID=A0A291C2P7_CONPC|nr:conotoxin [Conus praecellens]